MKITLSEFTEKATLVKKSTNYEVYDLSLESLVVSMTVLREGKSTVGHSHNDTEEVYFIVGGNGEMQVGHEGKEHVMSGDLILVPAELFHRVFNTGKGLLTFICVFEKYDGRGK